MGTKILFDFVVLCVVHYKNIFTIGTCEDDPKVGGSCANWAKGGECWENPNFMLKKCRKSCNVCGGKFVKKNQQFLNLLPIRKLFSP